MQFEEVYKFIIQKLETELPSYLTYHNVQHTKDVAVAAERLAIAEKLPEHEINLLRTAALFHDSGFIKDYDTHEEQSCILAKRLPPSLPKM